MSRGRQIRRLRFGSIAVFCLALTGVSGADETFVTIQGIRGNRITVVKEGPAPGRGEQAGGPGQIGAGARGPMGRGRGRGFRGRGMRTGQSTSNTIALTVPATAKITSAMRERRTFEFRVLAELPGGLRHPSLRGFENPLHARIVTKNQLVTEINVITGATDINHSLPGADGQQVIAVRPKRPPMKRKP